MKRILIALLTLASLFAIVPTTVYAQQEEEKVSVPKSMLNKDQLDTLASKNLQDKIEKYGKWVGVGHEIGTAVNESLSAVTAQANNFAGTPVGKLTMFVVVWKVIGHDLIGVIISISSLLFGIPLWIWSYRKYLPHRIVTEETYSPDNKSWFRRPIAIKYQVVMGEGSDTANWYRAMHFVFLFALFGLSMWVMFS